jgi:hypothetical protein
MGNAVKGLAVLMGGFVLFVVTIPFMLFKQPGDPGHLEGTIIMNVAALLMIAGPVVFWLVIPLYNRVKSRTRKEAAK